jgi:hypothetical protein
MSCPPSDSDIAKLCNESRNNSFFDSIPLIGSSLKGYVSSSKVLDKKRDELQTVQTELAAETQAFNTSVTQVLGKLTTEVSTLTNLIGGTGNKESYIAVVSETLIEPVSERVTLLIINGIALLIVVLAIIFLGL